MTRVTCSQVDVLITVSNERLLQILPEGMPLADAFYAADDVARQAITGVAGLLSSAQLINVDFADVRAVMQGAGVGLVTIGRASGPDRAEAAAEAALSSPLLDVQLEDVRGLAYSVVGGSSMSLHEVGSVGRRLASVVHEDAQV